MVELREGSGRVVVEETMELNEGICREEVKESVD